MPWNSQNNFVVLIIQAGTGFSGLFIYSGKPANGNLIVSVASQAGTDPFGNAYVQGVELHGESTLFSMTTNEAGETSAGTVLVGGTGVAGTTRQLLTQIFSPVLGAGLSAVLQLASLSADGTIPKSATFNCELILGTGGLKLTNTALPATPTGISELFSSAGTPQLLRPSSFTAALSSGLTDTTDRTVTQAVSTQLGGQFTIPANDAAVGTVYRYRCGGTGQWGATQQQLTLIQLLAGANVNQVNIAATSFAASDPVDWDIWLEVAVKSTGAGGSCNCRLAVDISKNNAASATNLTQVRRAAAVAINTTIANTFQLNALWAATVGAPTISGNYSTFERIGP